VFVKGFIEGLAGTGAEERRGLMGFKVELDGSIEKMSFALAVEGGGVSVSGMAAAAAAASSSSSSSSTAAATAATAATAALSPELESKTPPAVISSSKSFSFGGLLSKAKRFSLSSIDSKNAAAAAAAATTDSEPKQLLAFSPSGGWGKWLCFANRFACGRWGLHQYE
jgi:hypothetical protein